VRPFIWDGDCSTPLATYPDTPTHKRAVALASQSNMVSLFGLAPDGACHAPFLAVGAVGSYPTVSPLPEAQGNRRSILCGAIPKAMPESITSAGLTRHHVCVEPGLSSLAPFRGLQARSPDRLTGPSCASKQGRARYPRHAQSARESQHQ
jgi:hypothetical protein